MFYACIFMNKRINNSREVIPISVSRSPVGEIAFLFFQGRRIEALVAIQGLDLGHLIIRQRKIENVKIIFNMLRIGGFREDHIAGLDMPAKNDLNIGFAVFLCQFGKYRFISSLSP